ncbi:unnamed protein product [Absidia cylindrospora]
MGTTSTDKDSSSTDIPSDSHHHHLPPPVSERYTAIPTTHGIATSSSTASGTPAISDLSFPESHPLSNSSTTSSALGLLDHSPSTSTTDVVMNSDQGSAVRPYTHFRPSYAMNPTTPTTASIRFDERQDASTNTIDYTQYPVQNRDPTSHLPPQPQHDLSLPPSSVINTTTNTSTADARYQQLNSMLHGPMTNTRIQPDPSSNQIVMEPKQRGFYYQFGRIDREPPLLRRFAEQGVLTQASLLRKRRRQCSDTDNPYVLSTLPAPAKKPKIPHRHGEFEQRRDDIIHRMRSITMTDLEQKSQRLAPDSTLAIEHADLPSTLQPSSMTSEEAAELLEPSLRILTFHSNMKPHLDNGMNQNGIYYNSDYYRLYLAFIQFQKVFATLFPQEVVKIRNINSAQGSNNGERGNEDNNNNDNDDDDDDDDEYDPLAIPIPPSSQAPNVSAMSERDRDRDRNMNMKAYRGWIEPLLTETNWAAFRRNIVVGERMVLLTKVVGQGVLLMTKELSGSKLHLTFTNSEWDEFIGGLHIGKWDDTVTWHDDDDDDDDDEGGRNYTNGGKTSKLAFWGMEKSRLVEELKGKFSSEFWFYDDGTVVPSQIRKRSQERRRQEQAEEIQRQREAYEANQQPLGTDDDSISNASAIINDVASRAPSSPSSSSFISDVPTTSSITTSTTAVDTATAGQITLSSATLPTSQDKNYADSG